eukprot:TRINITY_DN684_c0_g1_i1.p3 TRINITY_DN684_c0_g1~~TRINITY_DN684_c0_g1_i1.p3  ORF type:complete len:298 (+),score=137.34 TRINITY_DN684_c0_g1_i1:904-1797(+)
MRAPRDWWAQRGRRRCGRTLLPPNNMNDADVPSFIIFDCSMLTKIDATAARTCFLQLQRLSAKHGFCIAYARLTKDMEALLAAHGALDGDRIALYPTVYAALAWCETTLIRAASRQTDEVWPLNHFHRTLSFHSNFDPGAGLTMAGVVRQILDLPDAAPQLEALAQYCAQQALPQGAVVFNTGEPAHYFCVLLEGNVAIAAPPGTRLRRRQPSLDFESTGRPREEVLLGPGAIFGYVDFQLEQERTFTAYVASPMATICSFTRESVDEMAERHPRLCILLERSVLKQSAMELANHSV